MGGSCEEKRSACYHGSMGQGKCYTYDCNKPLQGMASTLMPNALTLARWLVGLLAALRNIPHLDSLGCCRNSF